MTRLRLGVVGVGHLGKEHARILAGLPEVELVGVADANPEQVQKVARQCGCRAFAHHAPLLSLVDAAVIAVPTVHHHAIAAEFLEHGIALLVEKPLAATLEQADALVAAAERSGVILQVGHIERFNPAVEELRRRALQPKFVECERLGPFTGRSTDIGVVLDLMIHDLDLLRALVQAPVRSVQALGVALFGEHEDVANARLTFANGCVATLTASRASAAPSRRMRLWAPEGYVSVDFARRSLTLVQPTEHLRRRGLDFRQLDAVALARLKEEFFGRCLQTLHLDCSGGDQLTRELQHFVRCLQTGATPRVSGGEGRDAIALATRILESLRSHAWEGDAGGPMGPTQLPEPRERLFQPPEDKAAA
jgi:predicted dehydrogenase